MDISVKDDVLAQLRAAIVKAQRPFAITGSIPLKKPFKLLIAKGTPSSITFPLETPQCLEPLLEACAPASFGHGRKEVLDPTYRQALVLKAEDFGISPMSALDPYEPGIVNAIHNGLFASDLGVPLPDEVDVLTHRRIIAKVDKLNVYRAGDFFKPHIDTPKSPHMFGTLLINFPVEHTGGQLVIRAPTGGERGPLDDNNESTDEVNTNWGGVESLDWVAFFSDCPHEVLPVESGYRVTITYNLFIDSEEYFKSGGWMGGGLGGVLDNTTNKITELVETPDFLNPSFSRLCFHLEHQYPVDANRSLAKSARPLLKGRDAIIYQAILDTKLEYSFHFVIEMDPREKDEYISDKVEKPTDEEELTKIYGGHERQFILPYKNTIDMGGEKGDDPNFREVLAKGNAATLAQLRTFEVVPPKWRSASELKPVKDKNKKKEKDKARDQANRWPFGWVAFLGNYPAIVTGYASICIIASLPGYDVVDDWPEAK